MVRRRVSRRAIRFRSSPDGPHVFELMFSRLKSVRPDGRSRLSEEVAKFGGGFFLSSS